MRILNVIRIAMTAEVEGIFEKSLVRYEDKDLQFGRHRPFSIVVRAVLIYRVVYKGITNLLIFGFLSD